MKSYRDTMIKHRIVGILIKCVKILVHKHKNFNKIYKVPLPFFIFSVYIYLLKLLKIT